MQKAVEKSVKAISILMIAFMVITIVGNFTTLAAGSGSGSTSTSGGISTTPGQITGKDPEGVEDVVNIGQQIVGIITTVGVVIAVVIVLVLGIKYIMGSAAEKAEYKKVMIPYLVGAALLFAGSGIVNIVYNVLKGMNTPA